MVAVAQAHFRIAHDFRGAIHEDVLESVADDTIATLEGNMTLNDSCDWSMPTSGNWTFGEKEVPVRVLELVVTSRAPVVR
jgi:hypothetical protein